jgi:glycerophosphoryl diester phosphodiesterase
MRWRDFTFFAPLERGPVAIAHRGGVREGNEDPLAALRRSAAYGVRFVELDLRATASGDLLVWHGMGLERLRPNQPLKIEKLDPSNILLFERVLEELPSDTRFFVDLKNRQAVEALAKIVRRTRTATRMCIGSFSHGRTIPAASAIARETGHTSCTAMTPRQVAQLLAHAASPLAIWKAAAVSAQIPAWMATPRVIKAAHAGGALVFVWTVNNPEQMRDLLHRGADGLITDYPRLLQRVLAERSEEGDTSVTNPVHELA